MSLSAVILGGGNPNDPLAVAAAVSVKGLIPIAGIPMAAYVLKALRAGGVQHIVYVGATTPELTPLIDICLPAKGTMLENLQAGLQPLMQQTRVLVVTADIPLLTAEAVKHILEQDPKVGLVYPVVARSAAERDFPGGKRTYAKLREGTFTGGNLFLLEPRLVADFLPRLEFILENRKNVFRLASMFGILALIKLVLGQLSKTELEKTVSRILGVPAIAMITEFAEIGFDVDKPEDLQIVFEKIAIKS